MSSPERQPIRKNGHTSCMGIYGNSQKPTEGYPSSSVSREMQTQSTTIVHIILVRRMSVGQSKITAGEDGQQQETSSRRGCKSVPSLWKTVGHYLVGLTLHVPCAPAIPPLGICVPQKDSCPQAPGGVSRKNGHSHPNRNHIALPMPPSLDENPESLHYRWRN